MLIMTVLPSHASSASSLLLLLLALSTRASTALSEVDRLEQYYQRNYTWPIPPESYIPNTQGWRELMDERFSQIHEMDRSGPGKYDAYMSSIYSAFLAPNFTEFGFGLGRAPEGLMEALRQGIRDGLPTAREEKRIKSIPGPHAPWFIDRPDLNQRVLNELQAYPEAWSGVELVPETAYGFRLYRNQSALYMHVDKPKTHVISIILHVDSSEDAEPWPLFIEDFQGRTHEVILTSGDILFYESSKCFHGRPRPFRGTWYSSIFVHYHPTDWQKTDHHMETHYAVPPHWNGESNNPRQHFQLQLAGTGFYQPECPDDWCHTQDAIKWSGPGEPGYWIAPDFTKHPLDLDSAPSSIRQAASSLPGSSQPDEL